MDRRRTAAGGLDLAAPGSESIGKVQSVIKTGGTEILAIADENGKESLIPLVDSIVVEIDAAAKTIIVDPPEGLLDL